MSMIVTRTSGIEDAGILMIAFAIGNLVMMIGKYGMRGFQVTDLKNEYRFSVYLFSRIITVLTMVLVTVGYLVYAVCFLRYSPIKTWTVSMIVSIYMVESIEDLIWGFYQRKGALYIGARMFCFRWLSILIAFSTGMLCGIGMVRSLILASLVSLFVFLTLLVIQINDHKLKIRQFFQWEDGLWAGLAAPLIRVFPLFGASFLAFYLNNAPKYAIDACLDDRIQACYSFVAMPVFVIGLLNSFIYQPTLVPLTEAFHRRDRRDYHKRVRKQFLLIMCISVICIAGAAVFGIPVLSWLYHTDLSEYWRELVILQVAGGFLAVSGYQTALLTILRRQKVLLYGYVLVSLIALFSMSTVVGNYGTIGVAWEYLTLMIILCVIYGGGYIWSLRKAIGNEMAK